VRGENSAVKAMLAGKPFLWDFYKEKNGAHAEKIEDFLAFMEPFFPNAEDFRAYGKAIRTFNAPGFAESDFTESDARTCAEILTQPTFEMREAFGRVAESMSGRDLVKTVLSELDCEGE
jgi:hypothetical protein